jgi:hypothetical protein
MIIAVACPVCGRRYDVPGRLAGRRVRCKDCASYFRVPVPVTMPVEKKRRSKKKKRAWIADELLAEVLPSADPSVSEEAAGPMFVPSHRLPPSGPLLTPAVRIVAALVVCGLILAWASGFGPPNGIAVTLGVVSLALILLTLFGRR